MSMRWAKLAALPVLLLAVAGCIVVRPYDGPQTASIAYLNVQADVPYPPSVWIYRNAENCESRYAMQNAAHLGITEVSTSFAKIDAERQQSIGLHITLAAGATGATFCTPIVNFTPRAGRYYRLTASTEGDGCRASLVSADNPDFRDARKETYRKMIFGGGVLGETDSFCHAAGPGE